MNRYTKIWNPKSVIVIFVELTSSGTLYSAVKTKASAEDPLDVQLFDNLESIVTAFGKSKPYVIHVLGNGVLSRKIESSNAYKESLILNGDADDFLFSRYDDNQQMVVSFCRKSAIEKECALFAEQKWHLIGLSCGIAPVLPLIDNEQITLEYEIKVTDQGIERFTRAEPVKEKCQWEGSFWTQKELLARAIGKHLFSPNEHYISDGDTICAKTQENYRQFSQFKAFGIAVIGGIFLTLLGTYFYQNHLNQRVAELEVDLSVYNENLSMLDRLSQEKQRKQELIANAGVNAKNFLSYYLDEIGKSVPSTITLSEMTLFPVVGKLKNKQRVEVDQEKIIIAGTTKGNEIMDDWIEMMDRFEWVKSIELINYLKISEELAEFELVMTLE